MMQDLIMPLLCAGAEIETDDALAVEIVPRAMAAVVVSSRRLDWQKDEAEFLVDRDLCPYAGVARVLRRSFLPRVVSRLALLRNRVEDPETFAGSHIETPNVPFIVLETPRRCSFAERRADDDDIAADDRRALKSDLTCHEVGQNRLVDVRLEIDDAVRSKARNGRAGLRIERDQTIARRDVEDSFLSSVGPIGETASGMWTRGRRAARAFVFAMHPPLRARPRVERHDSSARAGSRVQYAAHHQRRALEFELRTRSERIRLEAPRNLERVEVAGIDLIERRVSRAARLAGVARPLALGRRERRSCLRGDVRRRAEQYDRQQRQSANHSVSVGRHPFSSSLDVCDQ